MLQDLPITTDYQQLHRGVTNDKLLFPIVTGQGKEHLLDDRKYTNVR